MSTPGAPGHSSSSQRPAPLTLIRRRTLIACSNCRRRKLRCIPAEQQPPNGPCTRCLKRGLQCEYVATTESNSPHTPEYPSSDIPESQAMPRPSPPDSSYGRGAAPPLPYTLPPPRNNAPRYSSGRYPDLSTTPQHPNYPAAGPSMPAMRDAYYAPATSAHRPQQPATIPAQPGAYDLHAQAYQYPPHRPPSQPLQYGQPPPMPFFAGAAVPDDGSMEWLMQDPNFGDEAGSGDGTTIQLDDLTFSKFHESVAEVVSIQRGNQAKGEWKGGQTFELEAWVHRK
ncbi:hypothetical protein C8F04DRAFT_1185267 [Mycena alexandri]|uniref:Zn(2)-C6 fungal-type domain-containing protein n=1 Tax=Mycena alexandri TaxID=1745969 RepID=A0AAD6X2A3_9AGAR|nr:hypothetical protein C8F04DRAFT_1185267 [Mycena alexandri]